MRVLMVTGYIPSIGGGGVEKHVYELACGLINRDVDVNIICEDRQYMPGYYEGIKDRIIPITIKPGLPLTFQLLRKSMALSRHVAREKYDIIHAHAQYGMATVLKNRILPGRKPVVVTLHGTSRGIYNNLRDHGLAPKIPPPSTAMNMLMESMSARHSDACIAVSRNVCRETHRYYGVSEANISVIYNWVEKARFYPRNKSKARAALGLDPTARYILYTGRTDAIKGYKLLIEAMGRVKDEATLLVSSKSAGEMGEKGMKNVSCLGYVDEELLPLYYSACDIFAFPSLYEGLPLTLIEAISCGAVPVCMRRPPMDEVVDDDIGYMCERFDAGEFADLIIKALNEGSLDKKSRLCVRRSQSFDMDRSIDRTLELYRSITKQ